MIFLKITSQFLKTLPVYPLKCEPILRFRDYYFAFIYRYRLPVHRACLRLVNSNSMIDKHKYVGKIKDRFSLSYIVWDKYFHL